MTAIAATFVDMRPIGTRKVCRLVFEVPAEQADTALEILGYPRPDDPVWVGIARLVKPPSVGGLPPEGAEPRSEADRHHPDDAPTEPKPKRKLSEMQPSQRAGMYCTDETFRNWVWTHRLNDYDRDRWREDEKHPADACANWLRAECGITSRAQLDTNPDALELFARIEDEYRRRNEPPIVPEHMR